MTPNEEMHYRLTTDKVAKFGSSLTKVCASCKRTRSIRQYKPGGTKCARCRGVR